MDPNGEPVSVLGRGRRAFDVPDDVAYFNTASLAPLLRSVRTAGETALDRRARPWTIRAEDWFSDVERLRALFGRLVGGDAEGVALVPATSYGFAIVARNISLSPRDRIVQLADEYPSGVYSWRSAARKTGAEILTATRDVGQTWTDSVIACMDEQVRVVSVPNVHWTDGEALDLAAISDRAREIGACLVIDASQSLGAMPMDVQKLRPDFVITVGYKWLLGPFGRGYLWMAERYRDGEPLEENWIVRADSEDFARLVDYRDAYQPGARRFDQGQRTLFEITPMAIAALEQLLDWQVPRIAAALRRITTDIAGRAERLGLAVPDVERAPHMLGLRLPKDARDRVVPALAQANCFAAVRGDALRISPHLHVTDADLDRLFDALASVL